MDFHQLLAKMQQLDQPVPETQVAEEPVAECPPEGPMGMAPDMAKPDTPPPSMSLNLNAQGMDNIEQLMALIKAVNPDMDKPAGGMPPSISIEPMDKPMGGLPPLKMLPDLSDEPHSEPDGDEGPMIKGLDRDGDGDHDMGDHDMEKKKDKEEAFGNSLGDSEPETMDMDAAIPNGNDLHKQKSMHRAAAGGDNAMAAESGDLRAQIRAELLQRLAEAKGAK